MRCPMRSFELLQVLKQHSPINRVRVTAPPDNRGHNILEVQQNVLSDGIWEDDF
jgi:hypothetical protein